MPKFTNRLQHAWNAFRYGETERVRDYGPGFYYSPQRVVRRIGTERSIVMALYNRISMDVAAIAIKHVRLDDDGRFTEEIVSGLNNCLSLEANIDQTARAFTQDVVLSMLEEGAVAVVPVDTTINPILSGAYDIESMRTGKIIQWYPNHVEVELYNERTGRRENVKLPKTMVAIIENPFYSVMNEPNSTLQRLIRKLNLLDAVDEQSGAGKLDLIIQLPYVIKSEARRIQAENRRKDIEMQLAGSKYGIAYTDGAERVTQLNRSVDNNLMKQVEYLTSMLYSQLGMTEEILKGTADEKTTLNYVNNTIEPIISAICNEYKRKFLTKTARTQMQSIVFFREPFKLVPTDNLAEIADKFTRNAILTSNEFRQILGFKPSDDPDADALRNKNLNQSVVESQQELGMDEELPIEEEDDFQQDLTDLDDLDSQLDELERILNHSDLMHYASPYYDPVKAHEYYMRTRELKGRRSTAGLNDDGKAASQYVKERLRNEKRQKIESSKNSRDLKLSRSNENKKKSLERQREAKKSQISEHKSLTQSRINSLKERLSSMSSAQRKQVKDVVMNQIAALRAENKSIREQISNTYKVQSDQIRSVTKSNNAGYRSEHKANTERAKAEYERQLDAEMAKIKATREFQKQKKRK